MGQRDMPCVKWTVFSVNIIICLFGLAFLIGGTTILFMYEHHVNFNVAQIRSVPMIFIYIGSFAFVFALLGACGAIARSACLSFFSSIVIILALLLQTGLLVFGSLRQNDMATFWNNSFSDMLENHKAHKETWDFMQNQLVCCGVIGPIDWNNGNNSTELPLSCCSTSNNNSCIEIDAHGLGCKEALLNLFNDYWITLFVLITAIVFIQMLLLGFSCTLHGVYRKDARDYYMEERTSF